MNTEEKIISPAERIENEIMAKLWELGLTSKDIDIKSKLQLHREEVILKAYKEELIKRIEKIKEAVRTQTGSFKYDSCYDDCINIIKNK